MEKMQETKKTSLHLVEIDTHQFLEMLSFVEAQSLRDGLQQYLHDHRCRNIAMDSKAVVLFKRFMETTKQVELPDMLKRTDWCPCVKDAQ